MNGCFTGTLYNRTNKTLEVNDGKFILYDYTNDEISGVLYTDGVVSSVVYASGDASYL